MKEIYRNDYGVSFSINNHPNPKYVVQIVINNIGLFMSKDELQDLLNMVQSSYNLVDNCQCETCKGKNFNKIGKSNNLSEFFLKIDERILDRLEDLIEGTQFVLNLNNVLKSHRIL